MTRRAVVNTGAAAAYVAAVGAFLYYAGQARSGSPSTPLIPIAMLMLLVFSAALTGALLFGQPVLWYLDGRKRDALSLLLATLASFLLFTVIAPALLLAR